MVSESVREMKNHLNSNESCIYVIVSFVIV